MGVRLMFCSTASSDHHLFRPSRAYSRRYPQLFFANNESLKVQSYQCLCMSKKQSRLHSSVNKFDVSLGTNIVLRHQMSDGDELV